MSDLVHIEFGPQGQLKKRRKKRKPFPWMRLGLLALLLLVVARWSLSLWFPPALNQWGARYGVSLRYDSMDLSLLGGQVTLRGLRIEDRQAPESNSPAAEQPPLAHLDYAVLDVSVAKLLRGTLRVRRAEVDGGRIRLHRSAEGSWNWQPWLEAGSSEDGPWWTTSAQGQWNTLRLQDLTVLVRDETQSPILETQGELDLSLADLGYQDRPLQFEVDVRAPGWVQGFHATGTSQASPEEWTAHWQADVYGLQGDLARRLLAPFGWTSSAEDHGLRLSAQVQGQRQPHGERDGEAGPAWKGQVQIDSLALQCDHASALVIDSLRAPIDAWSPGEWRFGAVHLADSRVQLHRTQGGGVGMGPLHPLAEGKSPQLAGLRIASLQAKNVHLDWKDETLSPPVRIGTTLEGEMRSLDWNADRGWQPIQGAWSGQAPEIAPAWSLEGQCTPGEPWEWSCDWTLEQANPKALDPYWQTLGWEASGQTVSARGRWNGRRQALGDRVAWNLEWLDVVSEAEGGESRLGRLSLQDWRLTEQEPMAWRAGALRVEHAQGWLERDALGRWTTPWGWRTQVQDAAPAQDAPSWILDEVHLQDVAWTYRGPTSQDAEEAQRFQIESGYARSLQPTQGAPIAWQSPEWRGQGTLPGWAQKVQAQGSLSAQPDRIEWDAQAEIQDWQTSLWKEPLAQAGWQSDWAGSDLQLTCSGKAQWDGQQWRGDSSVRDLSWVHGDQTWLALESAQIDDWRWQEGTWRVLQAQCAAPQFALERDERGAWTVFGMRYQGAPSSPGRLWPETWSLGDLALGLSSIHLDAWSVTDAHVAFRDDMRTAQTQNDLTVSAALRREGSDSAAPTWSAEVELGLGQALQQGRVHLRWTPQEEVWDWHADLLAQGLGPSDWSAYWPAEWAGPAPQVLWKEGRLETELAGTWRRTAPSDSSQGAPLEEWTLTSPLFALRDGGAQHPWLSFRDLEIHAARAVDDPDALWRIERSQVRDVRGSWNREASGAVTWLGLRWSDPERQANPIEAKAGSEDLGKASPAQGFDLPTTQAAWLQRLEAFDAWGARPGYFGPADWEVSDFRIHDATHPGDPRWSLAMHWHSESPWQWGLGTASTPLRGTWQGSISPGLESATLHVEAQPFEPQPDLRLQWEWEGYTPEAFRTRWPFPIERVQPIERLTLEGEGRLHARFQLPAQQATWRGAWQHGLALQWTALGLRLQENALTEPWVDIGQWEGEAPHLHPRIQLWKVSRSDVRDVRLRTQQVPAGVQALGLLWTPAALDALVKVWTETKATGEVPAGPLASKLETSGGQFDRIQGSRIDWTHTVQTTEPHSTFPVRNGEFEVLRLAWGDLASQRPMRLFVGADAGAVRVPMREATFPTQEESAQGQALESRSAWDRLEARGRLTFLGDPDGWLQLDVTGMELAPWRGWFLRHGLDWTDGRLDMRNTLRFRGSAGLAVDSRSTLDHLAVTPSRHSRIERELRLPGDWSSTLLALRDGSGHTQIPLRYELSRAAMGWSQLGRGWKEAFADLAQAPRSEAQVQEALAPRQALELRLPLEAGGASLTPDARLRLAQWVQTTAKPNNLHLVHRLGAQDFQQIQTLGSPAAEPLMELLQRLRRRKADLAQRYAQAAATARGLVQYGAASEAESARQQLVELDLARAETEQAIDQVLERLAPGAERQAVRRARAVAQDLARQRRQVLLQELDQLGWTWTDAQITWEAPLPRTSPQAGPSTWELRTSPSRSTQK